MQPGNLIPYIIMLMATLLSCSRRADYDKAQEAVDHKDIEISRSLSNQFVHTFGEDSLGHIWIGTFRGLNKFDSHLFHQYFASMDRNSIPDDQIRHIMRDSRGQLWIATVNGVCRYTDTDCFVTVKHPSGSRYIKEIVETSDGLIFFNNFDGSLMRYLPESDSCAVELPAMNPNGNFFINVHPDTEGKLWIRAQNFIKRYDPASGASSDSISFGHIAYSSFSPLKHEIWICGSGKLEILDTRTRRLRKLPDALSKDPVLSKADIEYIHPYGETGVLLVTRADGVFLYDMDSGRLIAEEADGFPFEVPDFKISTIFTDSRGNLWFGSEDQGYAVHYHYKERFNFNNYLRAALQNKSVLSVAADCNNRLWIVTKRDGLYIYDPSHNGLTHVGPEEFSPTGDPGTSHPYRVSAVDDRMLLMLKNNEIAECSFADGQFRIDSRHNIWMPMENFNDRNGTLWVGTATPYLCYKRKDSEEFDNLQVFEGFCFIPALAQYDDEHLLALAFNQPIKTINTRTLEVNTAPCDTASLATALRRSVFIPTCVKATGDSAFWIGTVTNGMLKYKPADGSFTRIEGLPCTDIASIEEDNEGMLWVSTMHGMARFDPRTMKSDLFFSYDGIGGNQFYDRASVKMQGGTLVFGGTHGLTFFRPDEVSVTPEVPLLFENLKIHNRTVIPGEGSNIDRHLAYAPHVRLNHDQNSFSISFVALDYCENNRVACQYRLVGIDTDWVDANERREAGYANISPGDYSFEVRVPSGDTFHTIRLRITVERAWWASWWALAAYILTGLAIIYAFLANRQRIRAERRAVMAAKIEKEQEQRINTMNMRFFANVSHEFRTPLSMISGPVSQLAASETISHHDRTLLDIIRPNVDRMLQLVNQMLDFNKLENDALKLGVCQIDVIALLRHIAAPFEATSRKKDISWISYGLEDEFLMYADEDKIIKIYTNLLSNALKFTPRGGCIKTSFDVTTDNDVRYAKITVENTGLRIPDDKLEKIFERYFQLDNPERVPGGSGIGLYYARCLAQLHHGSLKAEQPETFEGACFTLLLPIDREAYSADECTRQSAEQPQAYPLSHSGDDIPEENSDGDKALVLVVDDDVDMANYIKTLLLPYYSIVVQYDGEAAVNWLESNTPALIISDVVMPGSDGLSLCRYVKDDIRLCHIPLILVTAKATVENQIEGLQANADGYITKPFDPNLMLSKIRSLLFNRRKVCQIVTSSTSVDDVDEKILSPNDGAFLNELYQLMEQEISNIELDITNISRMMHMSRTKFYYKVKGLTGETPAVFFKTYKLNRAAQLILEGKHTISEIADLTGFTSLSHFSRSFKKQFGVAPSDYNTTRQP